MTDSNPDFQQVPQRNPPPITPEGPILPLQSYDDPEMELPPLPFRGIFARYRVPDVKARIIRCVDDWGAVRVPTIAEIIAYSSEWRIRKALSDLSKEDEKGRSIVKNIGYIKYGPVLNLTGQYFIGGAKILSDAPFLGRAKTPVRYNSENIPDSDGSFLTTKNFFVNKHELMVGESAALIIKVLKFSHIGKILPFPERVLKHIFGWYREKSDNKKRPFLFQTHVPDAWFYHPKITFRLEFQHADISTKRVEEVINLSPGNELVVYIVRHNETLYKRIHKLEDKYLGRIVVCDFDQMRRELDCLLSGEQDEPENGGDIEQFIRILKLKINQFVPSRLTKHLENRQIYHLYRNMRF